MSIILIGCTNPEKSQKIRMNESVNSDNSSVIVLKDSKDETVCVDTVLNKLLFLRGSDFLNDDLIESIEIKTEDSLNQFPYFQFCNLRETQYVKVSVFHGDSRKCFSQIEVGVIEDNDNSEYIPLEVEDFKTNTGKQIGMNINSLNDCINYSDFEVNDSTFLRTYVTNYQNKSGLTYSSSLIITNGIISRIKFGFDYP